jgi:hypothetical protein
MHLAATDSSTDQLGLLPAGACACHLCARPQPDFSSTYQTPSLTVGIYGRLVILVLMHLSCRFTGLSGSGKSTVACTLEHALYERGRLTANLDGDNIRHGLNKNLGFSAEDR